MLRHFQIKSNNPAYASGKATFLFTQKVKGKRRAAIIGIVPTVAEPSHASQNVVKRFQVDSAQHKQGDDFPLSLIAAMSGGRLVDNGGGTVSGIVSAFTNINALTAAAGSAQTTLPEIVRAQGTHIWAGGAATTDSIPVTGLEDGDVVHVELIAVASTETLSKALIDAANDQIDITLSANGTNGTTKLAYTVFKGAAFDELDDLQKTIATELATQRTLNTALMGALASVAAEVNRSRQGAVRGGFFPGRTIPLPDGSYCGGIRVLGQQNVEIELEDLTTNAAPVTELTLHCVEFPPSPEDRSQWTDQHRAVEALWESFSNGAGELVFYGNKVAQTSSDNFEGQEAEAAPVMPHCRDFRRLEVRHVVLDDTSYYVDEEQMEQVSAQAYTENQGAAQGGAVNARAIFGDGRLSWPGAVAVDLRMGESSLVALTMAAPDANKTHYLATVFAGRAPGQAFLEASSAAA